MWLIKAIKTRLILIYKAVVEVGHFSAMLIILVNKQIKAAINNLCSNNNSNNLKI